MKNDASILIIDDDQDILLAGKLLFKKHFLDVQLCNQPSEIPRLLKKHQFDAVLLDMNFGPGQSSGEQGFYWLEQILQIDPQMVVIMITAHGGIDTAVEAIKMGATDFVAKPWQNEKIVATLSSACELGKTRRQSQQLKKTNQVLADVINHGDNQAIIGTSSAMQNVMQMVEKTAATEANVLILGENGTGKELIARSLHKHSKRANQVFMSIDLGAVAENLFESELFGHKKGAFTDARQDRVGKIQAAQGGTLFLDEIANLPLHLQSKLLTVLEQRKVTPLGANEAIDIDVRIIAATNLTKSELSEPDNFRQDLLFRLNTVEITLPPLRERSGDIGVIAHHYADLFARKYQKPVMRLSAEADQALANYHWPGNVRALKHAIERAIILSDGDVLQVEDFQLDGSPPAHTETELSNELNLEKLEKQAIEQALKQYKYNISHAAKALGLTRAALYRRMEKHEL